MFNMVGFVDLCVKELLLCGVHEGETVAVLSQGDERRTYVITVPMQIKICKTTGTKYHAITCGEVAQARGRQIGTYTPCDKCIAVLRVPTGFEGLS